MEKRQRTRKYLTENGEETKNIEIVNRDKGRDKEHGFI